MAGKTVVVSPGHGWIFDPTYWRLQRPLLLGLREDFENQENCTQFLFPYLERAGARVLSTRERDFSSQEAIVAYGGAGFSTTGSWTQGAGAGHTAGGYGYAQGGGSASSRADWTPSITQSERLAVYVWYSSGANRAPDARYIVRHSGGETEVVVDQTQLGDHWNYIGSFHFEAGAGQGVSLSNQTATAGRVVVADAVKFGGGVGSIDFGGGTSGKPRWEEGSSSWVRYVGRDFASLFSGYGEVSIRPAYADWHGGDLFIMMHTNAGGGTGTVSFVHDSSPTAGSSQAMGLVHDHIVADIRTAHDPTWTDRGKKTGNFGELRVIDTMPAFLLELAFHDNAYDAAFERDPRWRDTVNRAISKGVVDYFAPGTPYAPVAPDHVHAINQGNAEVTISWRAGNDTTSSGNPPLAYKVYLSTNGKGFDNGWLTADTELRFAGMPQGQVMYTRVAAVGEGGESPPGPVVAFKVGANPGTLLVDGFDRLDERINIREGRQTFDYSIQHARALDAAGVDAFDGAANEAVEAGDLSLSAYGFIDWILGEESTVDETLSNVEQSKLTSFLNAGGALFISGSELTWDLDNRGSAADKSFASSMLRIGYGADNAGEHQLAASALLGTPSFSFAQGGNDPLYPVDYPDVLSNQGGEVVLSYGGGAVAGIGFRGNYKVICFGFPFETIEAEATRSAVMLGVLQYLQ